MLWPAFPGPPGAGSAGHDAGVRGLITAVIGILMMPWRLYADAAAYIFTWLVGYSSLMGALGGILIADYWIVRRQRLMVDDLFRLEGFGVSFLAYLGLMRRSQG
jgi:cytosine/uracil/thiamine/allantoin permease